MSHSIGYDNKYILPASLDQVPEAFRSNRSAKPIPCSVQTVNIPSLSGNQSLAGSSVIQVPCGASAGIMMNPYLRFSVQLTGGAAPAATSFKWKGGAHAATACINRVSSYVNSVQIDNQQSAWSLYDNLLLHSTSNDWLTHDATLMLGANVDHNVANGAASSGKYTFCAPLLGLLGSQQSFPLYLVNGTLQLQIDWQSAMGSIYYAAANDPAFTAATFSDVQLVFDRIQPEQAFVDKVRSDMMGGHKYVYSYTNYATTFLTNNAGNLNLNYGINCSSLRALIAAQYNAANFTTTTDALPISNGMTQFQLSLDGRLMNTVVQDSTLTPALCFSELQKCLGRVYDASISDTVVSTTATTAANYHGGSFLTSSFAAGVNCQRVNEALAFSGSPCSIASVLVNSNTTAGAPINWVAAVMYFIFISDFQLLIDATGSVEIVR